MGVVVCNDPNRLFQVSEKTIPSNYKLFLATIILGFFEGNHVVRKTDMKHAANRIFVSVAAVYHKFAGVPSC